MTNKQREELNKIEMAINEFCLHFVDRVFCDDTQELSDIELWWVGEDIGGVLLVNDCFFGFSQIVDFERYSYTPEEVFEYMDYCVDSSERDCTRNICNYREMMRKNNTINQL